MLVHLSKKTLWVLDTKAHLLWKSSKDGSQFPREVSQRVRTPKSAKCPGKTQVF